MNNVAIGGTTPLAGTFTDLRFNGTLSLAGTTGTAGFVLTSNGASAPTWQVLPATGLGIVDDTTTNATRYVTFTSATSGNITTENVSSTKLQFNPSTGILTSTGLAGALNGTVGATTPNTGAFTTSSLKGTTSGTITLAAAVVAGTNTATLPAATGTVMVSGNMPTFSASLASGTITISSATFTKMQLDFENWDTANCYDNTTNYRFTPNVAGYYQVSASVDAGASTGAAQTLPAIYKNGSAWRFGNNLGVVAGNSYNSNVSALVYLNGTTDYIEAYAYIGATTAKYASSFGTWFDAVLVRTA
jgi:hypothetical protein